MPRRIHVMHYLVFSLLLVIGMGVQAEVQTQAVTDDDAGIPLTGYLYWDDAMTGKRPGILVIHDGWGLNDAVRQRAQMLAELGYVAFAADLYGNGRVTDQPEQAAEWTHAITADVASWRRRASLGLAHLKSSELLEPGKIAAIGYGFGGDTLLQMAYDGTDLLGVLSFDGSCPAAPETSYGKITPKLLILHGQDDSLVTPEVIALFQSQLKAAGAHWELDIYGGARHGFANPNAGDDAHENLKDDAEADTRSWQRMQMFFYELFDE